MVAIVPPKLIDPGVPRNADVRRSDTTEDRGG
jgi:hypothetical protein